MATAASSLVNRITMTEVATHDATAPVSSATFIHIPAVGTPRADYQQERDDAPLTNNRGHATLSRPTRKGAKMPLEVPLFTGTKGFDGTGGDADPTSCFLQKAIESHFGSVANNNGVGATASFVGTTLAAGGTTSVPKFTSVANLNVGDIVAFDTTFQLRQVMAISGTDVTIDSAITSASAAIVVYGAFNFRMYLDAATGASAKHLYLNDELQGHGDLIGPGRFTGLSFENLTAGSGMRAKLEFDASTWTDALTPDTFTESAFTGEEIVAVGATLSIDGTEVIANIKSLTTGIVHAWHQASTGTNGRDGLRVLGQMNPQLTFSRLYAAADRTAFAARTGVHVRGSVSVGSTAAAKARGTLAFAFPNAERDAKHGIEDQMNVNDLTFIAKDPTSAQRTNGLNHCMTLALFGGV